MRSARHFRLGAVFFESPKLIPPYIEDVAKLKQKLGIQQQFEFHFALIHPRFRQAFFDAICHHEFYWVVCSFDKDRTNRNSLTRNDIRETTIGTMIGRLNEYYRIAEGCLEGRAGLNERVVFDRCEDASYRRLLEKGFGGLRSTRGGTQKLIRDVKAKKAKSEPCLQLADMVCGAVGSYLDGDAQYYEPLRRKLLALEILPKSKPGQ